MPGRFEGFSFRPKKRGDDKTQGEKREISRVTTTRPRLTRRPTTGDCPGRPAGRPPEKNIIIATTTTTTERTEQQTATKEPAMAKRLLELESKKLKLGELKRWRDELTDKIMQVNNHDRNFLHQQYI